MTDIVLTPPPPVTVTLEPPPAPVIVFSPVGLQGPPGVQGTVEDPGDLTLIFENHLI